MLPALGRVDTKFQPNGQQSIHTQDMRGVEFARRMTSLRLAPGASQSLWATGGVGELGQNHLTAGLNSQSAAEPGGAPESVQTEADRVTLSVVVTL